MNQFLSTILISLILIINAENVCSQNKLYVSTNSIGNNTGQDWNNAFNTIQQALNEAMANNNIDTICIAAGIYYPDQLLPGYTNERMRALHLNRGNLTILGSYNVNTNQRNLDSFPTILSGEIGDTTRIIDNAHYLFVIMGDSINRLNRVFIDGLVFEKAYGNNNTNLNYNNNIGASRLAGGALYTQHANVNISNSLFRNNETIYSASSIFCAIGKINIDNVIFEANKSVQGGNVSIHKNGSINIINSIFRNNQSNQLAATILLESQSNEVNTIIDCQFENNTGQTLFCTHESNTIFDYNNIAYNIARLDLLCNYKHNSVYTRNKIHNNSHQLDLFKLGLDRCIVAQNLIANNVGLDTLRSSIFNNYTILNDKKIFNNTIVNNKMVQFLNSNQPNGILFKNNIVAHNDFSDTASLYTYTHYNSYIQGNSDTINRNINALVTEPDFKQYDTQYANANFELEYCSPLINKGDTSNLDFINVLWDLNNNARIVSNLIDIGAFEKQSDSNSLNNVALSTLQDNQIPLIPICEDNEWTYYRSYYNTDSVLIGIKWGSQNEVAKQEANVYLTKDTSIYTTYKNTGDSVLSILPRYWHVDLGSRQLNATISIQFFYSDAEKELVSDVLNTNGFQIEQLIYITVPDHIDPSTQLLDFNFNNYNYTTHGIIPTVFNSLNAVVYTNLINNLNGTLLIKGKKLITNLNEKAHTKIKLFPNPTNDIIYLNDDWVNGDNYFIYNVLGEIVSNGLVYSSQINVNDLSVGVYILMINNEPVRFIKE